MCNQQTYQLITRRFLNRQALSELQQKNQKKIDTFKSLDFFFLFEVSEVNFLLSISSYAVQKFRNFVSWIFKNSLLLQSSAWYSVFLLFFCKKKSKKKLRIKIQKLVINFKIQSYRFLNTFYVINQKNRSKVDLNLV